MPRTPHLPQILQGPLAARPAAVQTPDWVWYFAWDDDGGAFYRPTPAGWIKATPSVGASSWQSLPVAEDWAAIPNAPLEGRRNGDWVEMRGGVVRNSGAFPSQVATLPSGFCPRTELRIPVAAGQTLATTSVASNGIVTVYEPATHMGGESQIIYFDAVRFVISQ